MKASEDIKHVCGRSAGLVLPKLVIGKQKQPVYRKLKGT